MIEGPWNPWWEGETEEAPMSDAADRILAGWPDASDAIACAKRVRELEAEVKREREKRHSLLRNTIPVFTHENTLLRYISRLSRMRKALRRAVTSTHWYDEFVKLAIKLNETENQLSHYRPDWTLAPEWATECAIVWRSDESDIEAIHTERRPEDE